MALHWIWKTSFLDTIKKALCLLLAECIPSESSQMQMKGKCQPLPEGNGHKSVAACPWTRCHHSLCWNKVWGADGRCWFRAAQPHGPAGHLLQGHSSACPPKALPSLPAALCKHFQPVNGANATVFWSRPFSVKSKRLVLWKCPPSTAHYVQPGGDALRGGSWAWWPQGKCVMEISTDDRRTGEKQLQSVNAPSGAVNKNKIKRQYQTFLLTFHTPENLLWGKSSPWCKWLVIWKYCLSGSLFPCAVCSLAALCPFTACHVPWTRLSWTRPPTEQCPRARQSLVVWYFCQILGGVCLHD